VIAFDTSPLASRFRYHGLYAYTHHLLAEFQKFQVADKSVVVCPFVDPGASNDANSFTAQNILQPKVSNLLRMEYVWRCGGASLAAFSSHSDLLFSPSPYNLYLGLVPVVTMIADITPMRLSSEMQKRKSIFQALIRISALSSKKIITMSDVSKNDLVEICDVAPEKVSVIYCGYHKDLFNRIQPDERVLGPLLALYGIRQPYIFYHSTVQPRKNHLRLIEAYSRVMDMDNALEAQLVLAGSFDHQFEPVARAKAELKNRGKVIFTGPLPEQDLACLLKGSVASVIPSLYEGFCLPMVESMACGIPTIASNSSCLQEVSGGVLRYFDPLSVEEMAFWIERVLQDSVLRNELSNEGEKRTALFSWEKCARETLDLLIDTCEEFEN